MKCISLRPDYADEIVAGEKLVEHRTWQTSHRGDLLIHANRDLPKDAEGLLISGYCIAVVRLDNIKPRQERFDWILTDVRPIEPIPVKGRQRLFDVDDDLVQPIEVDSFSELLDYWGALGLIDLDKINSL